MTYELRLAVIVLAAFAATSLLASAIVPAIARRVRRRDPAVRATQMWRARALPMVIGLSASMLAATAYLSFEPYHEAETTGLVLTSLAVFTALVWVVGAGRLLAHAVATRRAVSPLLVGAEAITLEGISARVRVVRARFPLVAVVGLFRPTLLIARSVLDECPPDELRAILAHEQAHILRRDNLRRLIFQAAPDVLDWGATGRRLCVEWQSATEQAADDASVRLGEAGRVSLAQALIRVARLAPDARLRTMPISALYRGEDLEPRVRRLLAPRAVAAPAPTHRFPFGTGFLLLLAVSTLQIVHDLMEVAVALLP